MVNKQAHLISFDVVKVHKLDERAKLPFKKYNDLNGYIDLGWDLYSLGKTIIPPHQTAIVSTGLAMEFPAHLACFAKDRSSTSLKWHIVGGVIDSGYRGPIAVNVYNPNNKNLIIEDRTRFCQLVFIPVIKTNFVEVDKLNANTDRGENCLGSTDTEVIQ